ncbi:MAG: hypothetical protein M1813_004115 [Trichoglossum hirsutum]|nr:MAG: hypothetical protein M1813_004115 [Trichoglossum hirsutum]
MIRLAISGPRFGYGKDRIAKDRAIKFDYDHLFSEVSDRIKSAGAAGYGAVGVNAAARASAVVTEARVLLNVKQEDGPRKGEEGGILKEGMAGGSLVNQEKRPRSLDEAGLSA